MATRDTRLLAYFHKQGRASLLACTRKLVRAVQRMDRTSFDGSTSGAENPETNDMMTLSYASYPLTAWRISSVVTMTTPPPPPTPPPLPLLLGKVVHIFFGIH